MVEENEIMCGNYFIHNDNWCSREHKGIFQFDSQHFFELHQCTFSLENVSPILLTEDILIRCGFERCVYSTVPKSTSIDVIYYKGYGIIVYLINYGFEIEIGSDNRTSTPVLKIFKYLHTLQNFVKLLCNQTIELK